MVGFKAKNVGVVVATIAGGENVEMMRLSSFVVVVCFNSNIWSGLLTTTIALIHVKNYDEFFCLSI